MTVNTLDDYIDSIGTRLEHNGLSDEQIDTYFLEHFGTKGMKWGQRRAANKAARKGERAASKAHEKSRSGKQKLAIAAVGSAAGLVGLRFVMGRTMNLPLSAAVGGAAAVGGIKATQRILDKRGSKKVSELS